ncbi:dUTP diphosphatase [Coprococcus phoceensis]
MKKIAKFEKVSFEQFKKDWLDTFNRAWTDEELLEIYDNIQLPKRATRGSAGYDFKSPLDFTLTPGSSIKIPTGIRCKIEEGWVLKCYPRSGLGFKFRIRLFNTVAVVDSDYFYSDNEGHIFIKLANETNDGKLVKIKQGEGFAQGVFVEYGITVDDDEDEKEIRNGGFGSTTK